MSDRYLLTKIFEKYDEDRSCEISKNEFECLIFDLLYLRDGVSPLTTLPGGERGLQEVVTAIAKKFPIAERLQGVSLDQFIAAANVTPFEDNPFNDDLTQGGLLRVLTQKFEPSFEFKLLPPWETVGYGLTQMAPPQDLRLERKLPTKVKIDFPLRLTIFAPSLQRTFRVDASSRNTSVDELLSKLLSDLPANTRPSSSSSLVQLMHKNTPLDKVS